MEAKLVKHRFAPGGVEVRLAKTWVPCETGELAIQFATHFGIVAAKRGAEDSKGRSALELQTVDEVVERSCKLAKKLVKRMKKEGWIVEIPDLPEETELPAKTETPDATPPAEPLPPTE